MRRILCLRFENCKHILAAMKPASTRAPTKDEAKARGGIARAASLTSAQRADIAKRAAMARWEGPIKKATHGSSDRPLRFGDITIDCYVLEDETRVLSQRGLQRGIGLSESGGRGGARRITELMARLQERGINTRDLASRTDSPIRFVTPHGPLADGYDARILPDICAVLIEAGQKDVLGKRLEHLAERAAVLQHGFATIGIIGLVDEATGYQEYRAQDALAKILRDFISKELQDYVSTFPADYYKEMFRLRGLDYPRDSVKRPRYFGVITNDIVYNRLAPGVLEELKRVTPRLESGRYKNKLFQRLTANKGYPKLREHLGAVVTMMQLSNDWHDFISKLDRLRPRLDIRSLSKPQQLSFDYDSASDSGRGL
jgi:hypothetical protein